MSADEMTDVEAHALLGRAFDTEPVVRLHPESVLGLARRSRARRRLAVGGVLAMTITAVAAASTVLTGPAVGDGLAVVPAAGVGGLVQDDRSRRLTEVLADAHVIPPGTRVERDPEKHGEPLVFGTSEDSPQHEPWRSMYMASAQLTDALGSGRLQIVVAKDNSVMARPDGLSCAAYPTRMACAEKTLPGDIRAVRLTEYRSAGQGILLKQRRDFVFAARANGSYILVYSDDGTGGAAPARRVPPVDVETMFRIAGLPGMEY